LCFFPEAEKKIGQNITKDDFRINILYLQRINLLKVVSNFKLVHSKGEVRSREDELGRNPKGNFFIRKLFVWKVDENQSPVGEKGPHTNSQP
jgi:hypothetical protein